MNFALSYVDLFWMQRYHARRAFRYVPLLIAAQLAPSLFFEKLRPLVEATKSSSHPG